MGDFPFVGFPHWINKLYFKQSAGMGVFSYTPKRKGSAVKLPWVQQ